MDVGYDLRVCMFTARTVVSARVGRCRERLIETRRNTTRLQVTFSEKGTHTSTPLVGS